MGNEAVPDGIALMARFWLSHPQFGFLRKRVSRRLSDARGPESFGNDPAASPFFGEPLQALEFQRPTRYPELAVKPVWQEAN